MNGEFRLLDLNHLALRCVHAVRAVEHRLWRNALTVGWEFDFQQVRLRRSQRLPSLYLAVGSQRGHSERKALRSISSSKRMFVERGDSSDAARGRQNDGAN